MNNRDLSTVEQRKLNRLSLKQQKPLVQALHNRVKGRVRYKVRGLQRSENLQQYLEFRLSKEPGIDYVRASSWSGNILILFTGERSPKAMQRGLGGFPHERLHQEAIASLVTTIVKEYRQQPQKAIELMQNWSESASKPSNLMPLEFWHLQETKAILTELDTSRESGLSLEKVQYNLQKYGANVLAESQPRSGLSIFIDYFKSVPVALLTLAAGLSVVTGGIIDAVVIMGVVVINAILGYATESQSERIIHSLKSLVNPSAWTIRASKVTKINSQEIVIGDILVLKPGSYVAADARLIEAERLTIDESALTGESIPVLKTAQTLTGKDVPLAERVNMVYRGTLVTGGQGLAVVVATGQLTEMGRIQTLVGETIVPQTPMEKELDRAGGQLVILSSGVCGVVFALGLMRGYGVVQMLKTSISLAVAAVPEGLPTVATTTLALGIGKMRRHNVLIRRLDAIEALGSVQTICLDKTGTLTANQMSVVELCTDCQRIEVTDGQFLVAGEPFNPYSCDELLKLIHVSILCNESKVNNHHDGKYIVNGSATENALMQMAIAVGIDVLELQRKYPRLEINHRSEERNFMRTVHIVHESQKLIAVKGNPTEVLELCAWKLKQGELIPLTESDRQAIEEENERMAGKALRVLGAAYAQIDDIEGSESLIWLGLMGMADPVRHGVKELMGSFHQAGIKTVMITGDQSPTAYAIGKELNLSQGKPLEILDSTDLTNLDSEVMKGLCDHVQVFARISPVHKLQIVQSLQQAGKVVAMTGDGINDAPALKAAEVGIAMGHAGTDAAREVADVVLEDDRLETMIIAVSQGRTIYNNIRKSVHFLLSTNLSEIMVMLLANGVGLGQPLNAMQLLWLNMVTDIFPGLALALEPPEPEVLQVPPRSPEEPILNSQDFQRIISESTVLSVSSMAAYGYGIARYGISPHASSIAFMSLVTGQLLHALSCRSTQPLSTIQLPPNHYLTFALGGSLTLQLICLVIPGLRNLLQVTPLNLLDGVVISNSALLPLLFNEGTKKVSG
ncbi:MAG: HAD-IC family P-type ATPase [Xenococcaceae cyanobacterium MO_207.B15]|nr:HAD-IC family P-type ATPase [Xenococcaceae cyanobacterium MO_207.B15]